MTLLEKQVVFARGDLIIYRPWHYKDILPLVLESLANKDTPSFGIAVKSALRAYQAAHAFLLSDWMLWEKQTLMPELLLLLESKGVLQQEGFLDAVRHTITQEELERLKSAADQRGILEQSVRILNEYNILKPSSSSAVKKNCDVMCCVLTSSWPIHPFASLLCNGDTSYRNKFMNIIKKLTGNSGIRVGFAIGNIDQEPEKSDDTIEIHYLGKDGPRISVPDPYPVGNAFSSCRLKSNLGKILQLAGDNSDTPFVVWVGVPLGSALRGDAQGLLNQLRKENVIIIAPAETNGYSCPLDIILVREMQNDRSIFSIDYPDTAIYHNVIFTVSGKIEMYALHGRNAIKTFLSQHLLFLGLESLFKEYEDLNPVTPLRDALGFYSLFRDSPRGSSLTRNIGFLDECVFLHRLMQEAQVRSQLEYAAAKFPAAVVKILAVSNRIPYDELLVYLEDGAQSHNGTLATIENNILSIPFMTPSSSPLCRVFSGTMRQAGRSSENWLAWIAIVPASIKSAFSYLWGDLSPPEGVGYSFSFRFSGVSSSPVTPSVSAASPRAYPIINKDDISTGETWVHLVKKILDEPAFAPEKSGVYTALALTMEDVLSGYEPWLKLSDKEISSIRARVKELAGKVASIDFIWSDEYYQELKNLLSHVPTIENPHTELFVDVFEGFTPRQMEYMVNK
ncbi:MAG: hypothetical protein MJA29_11750, partial [Candidatus Omnitrophica bacterium]|nr:hypothetical protein [Candidatus Omnitrophota bacterium]